MNTHTLSDVPRLQSLHHRLKTAKGADGELLGLLDELMVFLEDPPPEVGDRWQAAVDLCAAQGVVTSRTAVWRLYRAHIVEWRYENAEPVRKVSLKERARMREQTRQLLHLRAMESLRHPYLPPRVLVGLVQSENRRQELQLARDKFDEQLFLRQREDDRAQAAAMKKAADDRAFRAVWAKSPQGAPFESFLQAMDAEKAAQAASPPFSAPAAKS